MTAAEVCEQQGYSFAYKGLVHSGTKLYVEGCERRRYEDSFFCSRCLRQEYRNPREIGYMHHAPVNGSMPK